MKFDTILERNGRDLHLEVDIGGERPSFSNGYSGEIFINSVTDLSGAPVECTEEEYEQLIQKAQEKFKI